MGEVHIVGLKSGRMDAKLEIDTEELVGMVMSEKAKLYIRDPRETPGFERVTPFMICEAGLQGDVDLGIVPFELEGSVCSASSASSVGPSRVPATRDNLKYARIDNEILSAALTLLSEHDEDFFKSVRGRKSVNAEAVAGAIDDQRHRWPLLVNDGYGTSRDKILSTLRASLKNKRES